MSFNHSQEEGLAMADIVPRRRRERGEMSPHGRESSGRLQETFDNFFDNFFAPIWQQWSRPWFPEVAQMRFWDFEVEPKENEVVVRAEMPGFEPDDIDVRKSASIVRSPGIARCRQGSRPIM
jgi:HSP20 family molecular chaperone IbpA